MNRKKSRQIRTNKELREGSEHLFYEVSMFYETINLFNIANTKNQLIKNILTESFTMRIRILLHFFFPKKIQKDDIIAEDYFDNSGEWNKLCGDLPFSLEKVNYRVGKEIAHLTYFRLNITPEKKIWDWIQIGTAIDKIIKLFHKHVSKEKLCPSWINFF